MTGEGQMLEVREEESRSPFFKSAWANVAAVARSGTRSDGRRTDVNAIF